MSISAPQRPLYPVADARALKLAEDISTLIRQAHIDGYRDGLADAAADLDAILANPMLPAETVPLYVQLRDRYRLAALSVADASPSPVSPPRGADNQHGDCQGDTPSHGRDGTEQQP